MEKDKNTKAMFSEDRDSILLKIMDDDRNNRDQAIAHMGDLVVKQRTVTYWSEKKHSRGYNYWSDYRQNIMQNDKISLVMAPAWGVIFPPYNLARLTGLLRHHGYAVDVHDINVDVYQYLIKEHNVDYWESQNYYKWEEPVYSAEVHPKIEGLLNDYVTKIIEGGSDFIGFSLYQTNLMASLHMMKRIKEIDPSKVIIVGGPEAFNTWFEDLIYDTHHLPKGIIDYCVKGEGEQELLTLMENHNEMLKDSNEMTVLGGLKSNLDLNKLPFPDYSDYQLDAYQHSDGVSIETSRGCVAKCTFCAETHFWKYRWRDGLKVIEEMKYQINQYGINRFWFVDSLVNGNMKEFKILVDEINNSDIDIRWNSYARCDGRMDAQMFKDIVQSGCVSLSFGVESGSEKVLTDMKKVIKVWEIENNLRDAHNAGIKSHVNWVVGFPTENPQRWTHSLHVLHNCRKWIHAISPGMTCGDAAFSDLNKNWAKYEIQWKDTPWDETFTSNWFTKDYKSTIIHRFIRLKFMNVWLRMMQDHAGATLFNGQDRKDIRNFYKFSYDTDVTPVEYVDQREEQGFDYFNTGTTNIDLLSDGLANEYLPIPWMIYQVYGAHTFEMNSRPEQDIEEFGGFLASHYNGDFKCSVLADGTFTMTLHQKFEHKDVRDDGRIHGELDREDMSFDWKEYSYSGNISDFDGIATIQALTIENIPLIPMVNE
jgi:hypothetical protein